MRAAPVSGLIRLTPSLRYVILVLLMWVTAARRISSSNTDKQEASMKKALSIPAMILVFLVLAVFTCSAQADVAGAATIPVPTPAPTEVPAEVTVTSALEKLTELNSLRMDMDMLMDMEFKISSQGFSMNMPIQVAMDFLMDVQKEPQMSKLDVKMDMNMSAMGQQSQQTNTALVYVDMSGDQPVSYSSTDEGATWHVGTENAEQFKPQESISLLKEHAKDFQKTGTGTVYGREVTIYSGKLEGAYAQQTMASTGMSEVLSEIADTDDVASNEAVWSDILVTVSIDNETGYPVFYSMDMTDMLKDLLEVALKNAMGMEEAEGMEIELDVSVIKIDSYLTQFDSVPPIEIPEAALAAANN